MTTDPLVQTYLEGLCQSTGSPGASLYLPPSASGLSEPLLIHAGGPPVARELADFDSALRWAERAGEADASPKEAWLVPDWPAYRSRSPESVLIPLVARSKQRAADRPGAGRRRHDRSEERERTPPLAWVALLPTAPGLRAPAHGGDSSSEGSERAGRGASELAWLLEMGCELCLRTIETAVALSDRVTGLKGRSALLAALEQELEVARSHGEPLGVALVNPDGFGPLGERFEREVGDRAVKEMATTLSRSLRNSDLTFRYGAAVFAVVLPQAGSEDCRAVVDKVLSSLASTPLLDGAVQLAFSSGFVVYEPDDGSQPSAEALLGQADRALGLAKKRGGGIGVEWSPEAENEAAGPFDRLTGLFTGRTNRDYRNMVLLWDAVRALSGQHDYHQLGATIVDWLHTAFKAERVALFSTAEGGALSLVHGVARDGRSGGWLPFAGDLEDVELAVMEAALQQGRPQLLEKPAAGEKRPASVVYTVPLRIGERVIGGLLFDGDEAVMSIGEAEQAFLETLAPQLALALDRARLAELETQRREEEQRRLRFELQELRGALQQAALIYESPQMESLVQAAKRVAATDATVLITGHSGTGKELLARTVHELSPRREGPFVVVDCAALSSSLIESELFGHSRGAFTGAQAARTSRLAEAVGGTLVLDEVGELPLDVQSKLLRFVQEKQYVPVGSSKPKQVDVRIVAATNRDLAAEVEKGRFREDLYYRLSVVHLELPPLSERRDDVIVLARHFLSKFALRYQKRVDRFSEEAQRCLLAHDWPGNVRELQNRVLKGVVFCDGDRLTPEALGFGNGSLAVANDRAIAGVGDALERTEIPPQPVDPKPLFEALGRSLRNALEASAAAGASPPLGRWLATEMILTADRVAEGVARRGAAIVGLPESTFRRRLARAASSESPARSHEPIPGWDAVRAAVQRLVSAPLRPGNSELLAEAERVLLEEIRGLYPRQTSRAAALLGVSPPTFRRRLAQL